ncbi:hypothetical protein LINPERPRIM_LOCUS26042 [Linum perenne]
MAVISGGIISDLFILFVILFFIFRQKPKVQLQRRRCFYFWIFSKNGLGPKFNYQNRLVVRSIPKMGLHLLTGHVCHQIK